MTEPAKMYDHGPETPWVVQKGRDTSYKVTDSRSSDPYLAPGAVVTVTPPSTRYFYESQDQDHIESIDNRGDLMRHQMGEGPDGQQALFGVRHTHPYVSWMQASSQFRTHLPTLLSVAHLQTRARYGEGLRSDSSLSDSASPLVQRLARAGVVQAPQHETRNHYGSRSEDVVNTRRSHALVNQPVTEIPQEQVQMGRQFLRHALRRS